MIEVDEEARILDTHKNDAEFSPIEEKTITLPKYLFGLEYLLNLYYKDTIPGAVLTFINSIIGGGILFLPKVIKEMGIVLGFSFIAWSGFLASVAMYMLYKSYMYLTKKDETVKDFEQLGNYCYGKWMSYCVQLSIIVINFGGVLSYSVVIADITGEWIKNQYIHALVLLLILCPTVIASMFKKIASLRISGYLTVVSILLFIVSVCICYFFDVTENERIGTVKYLPKFNSLQSYLDILGVLGIVTFSFSCSTNLLPIVSQFKPKNRYKSGIAIFFSIELIFFLYSFIAEFGYLSFLDNTQSDLVKSFKGGSIIVTTLRILVLLAIVATWPNAAYLTKYTMTNLFFDVFETIKPIFKKKKPEIINSEEKKEENKKFRDTKFGKLVDEVMNIGNALVIGIVSYLFAVFYEDASAMFSVVGSSASTLCSYVFPCLFFLKLCPKTTKWYVKLGVFTLLIYGLFFGIVSTTMSFLKLINVV